MIAFFNMFVKVTGYLAQKVIFRTKIYYEDKALQSRRIKGKAIIMSNHCSVYDYAVYMFVFFSRTVRYLMAEVLYKKPLLSLFLKMLGGIKVDRDAHTFNFITKSIDVLNKGGVVGVFPESRLPKEGEERPLEFKPSITYLALESESKIIPVYTSGNYFKKSRVRVIIGKPINVLDYYDENLTEKENIDLITKILRQKIIELGNLLNEKTTIS